MEKLLLIPASVVRYAPVYEATPQSTPPTPLEPLSKTVSRDSISSSKSIEYPDQLHPSYTYRLAHENN